MRAPAGILAAALLSAGMGTAAQAAGTRGFDAIEVRLVDTDPAVNGPVLALDGTGEAIEVAAEVLLGRDDFEAVGGVAWTEGRPGFEVRLTENGSRRLQALSAANVGRRLAIIIDGRVMMAPKILDPIVMGGFLVTTAGSEAEAKRLAEAVRAALAGPGRAGEGGRSR